MRASVPCSLRIGVCFVAASMTVFAQAEEEVRIGPDGVEVVKVGEEKEERPVGAAPVSHRGEPRLSRVRIRGAAEPSPAMKYSFEPEFLDQKPGNAAPYYYRALMNVVSVDRDTLNEMEEMSDLEVGEINAAVADHLLASFRSALSELQVATHREHCNWDWRVRDRPGAEQVQFLLNEVQNMRTLGRVLSVKAGSHISKGEFEEAVETLKVGYQMAKDVSEPTFLVNDLVGIAIASLMNRRVIEMIDAPDSPNLYWAMASLPRPLVDMRNSLRHERSLPYKFFPFLLDPENAGKSEQEWAALIEKHLKPFREDWAIEGTVGFLSRPETLIAASYPRAKRELVVDGYDKKKLDSMPVAQVVAIHEARVLRRLSDNLFKWSLLPYHESEDMMNQAAMEVAFDFSPFKEGAESLPIGSLLLPPVSAATRAEVRLQTEIDGIRVIEAIRMQMAADDGEMPLTLEEIEVVPIPRNPSTNQPFKYRPLEKGKGRVLEMVPGKNPHKQSIWNVELIPTK